MTRAQIILDEHFNGNLKTVTYRQPSIYLHGDSYPEAEGICRGVFLPILCATRLFLEIRGYFDTEYLLARLVQHLANQRDLEFCHPKRSVTGIGIMTERADYHYLYIITPTTLYCYEDNTLIKESKFK